MNFKMKKLTITALILVAGITAQAQQPAQHLPAKLKIELTDHQVLRIDSAINLSVQQMDSKQFTAWFMASFKPLYDQIKKQMIVDTAKAKKP